jgi:hypothetical protein
VKRHLVGHVLIALLRDERPSNFHIMSLLTADD